MELKGATSWRTPEKEALVCAVFVTDYLSKELDLKQSFK